MSYLCCMGNKSSVAMFTLSGILILFATYASLLPDVIECKSSVVVNTDKTSAIDYLSNSENWKYWLFEENTNDDSWRVLTSGPKKGVGSVLKWLSDEIGDGGLEIKKITKNQIVFERITDNNAFRDRGYINFSDSDEGGVKIEWIDSLDVSTSFMARYAAQEETYVHRIDSVNLVSLNQLKSKLEAK